MSKVIFVIFQTGTRANGGVESISQVIERLSTIKPIIVTQIETPVNERWRKAGAEVHVWSIPYNMGTIFSEANFSKKWQRLKSILATNYQMFKLVRSLPDCQVVHLNDYAAFRHTGIGAKLAKASLVLNIRDINPPESKYGSAWQRAFSLTDAQLVLSQEMRQGFIERLKISDANQEKIHYIYSITDPVKMYAVDPVNKQEIRSSLQINSDIFAIGYIATFNDKKAQLNFVKNAGVLLKNRLPQAKVYFLGDFEPEKNDYSRQCQEKTQTLNLENTFKFMGYTPFISDWYKALDVIIVPTLHEGLARCMIESLSCGIPVISFDVCSAKEILEGYNCGLVVKQGDYVSLVEKIADLAEHQNLYETLSANAAKTSSLFAPIPIVEQYEKLYLSLT